MSVFLQPIFTQTASGSANSITFNNIPQTYTDLQIVISARSTYSSWIDYCTAWYNGDRSSIYTDTYIYALSSGTGGSGDSATTAVNIGSYPAATSGTGVFGSINYYMPNYRSSNYKSAMSDFVLDMASTSTYNLGLWATLYSSSNAITSVTFYAGNGNFASGSTFSLYGILRQGV